MGITISFAGKPKINAIIITPSSPISRPNGSRKSEQYLKSEISPIYIFAIIQIKSPAGAATAAARPNTNKVLSNTERIKTLPIRGFLYGGSSIQKVDASPFKYVFERKAESIKVSIIPSDITSVRMIAEKTEPYPPIILPAKNIVITDIIVGKRPLHGISELVIIAISLSRGESIILQPTTPAALQPRPIHIYKEI